MKFFIAVSMALMACAYADVSELGYDYHQPAPIAPHKTYIPPAAPKNTYIPPEPKNTYIPPEPKNTYIPPEPKNTNIPPAHVEQPHNTYIPPAHVEQPKNTYIPPAAEAAYEGPAEDGYRYKTVRRRVVYKNRA